MAVSVELLNSTLQDFKGPLVLGWQQNAPLRAMLMKKGKVSTEGGAFVERALSTGSPARGVGVFNGDEVLNQTRYQKLKKLRVDYHRVVASINIPKKELNMNRGKNGVLSLIKEYPKAYMDAYGVDREKYLLTGKSAGIAIDSAELYGYLTLNGQFSSGIGTGNENGLLDFIAKGSQTDLVQNLAKSEAMYHYNQYADIPAWGTDGVKVWRRIYRACAQWAGKVNGGPDLIICDDDTFGNYQLSKADIVRTQKIQDNPDKGSLVQDVLGVAGVYPSQLIDIAADFTGVAALGVTYMINTDFVEIIQLEAPNMSDFADLSPQQDAVSAKYSEHEAMFMGKLPAHAAISGGAT